MVLVNTCICSPRGHDSRILDPLPPPTFLTLFPPRFGYTGGALGPAPDPSFESQIFAAAATPLRDVGKISLGPPYTNSGSARAPPPSFRPPSVPTPYAVRRASSVNIYHSVITY